MTVHARVAIVGGGIYGCGIAHQLTECGWNDVVLLEKNELTAGSTWHAAGFCTHYSFNLTHVFMRKFSTELYRHLEEEGIEPTGYHRCRGLRLTSDPDRIDEFRHGASVGRQLGIDFEIIGPSEIESIFPLMRANGVAAALYEPIDGYVDPAQATHAMARLARAAGAKIYRGNPVRSIERTSAGEWCLRTPEHEVIAEHIVIAAGFWANEVGKLIGLDLPIVPMLHQYLVTEDHPSVIACARDSIPLVRDHDHQWYVRRERDGLILGAYESTPQTWSVDGVPPEFGMELLAPELDRVEHLILDAVKRIPVLGEAGIKTTVHGPVSYTPDGQPLLGPAPGLPNAWIAAGSGFGIGEGAGAGHLLAHWMIDGAPPMHMWAFDPRRFGAYADRDFRIAKATEVFSMQFATHYPLEERAAARGKKKTQIYDRLQVAGARFGSAYGWERANWFTLDEETHSLSFKRTAWFDAVARECQSVAGHAGVIDLSGFTKYVVSGLDAELVLDQMSANRLPGYTGEIRLCHFLNANAQVECEFTITKIDDQKYYLVCAAVAERHHMDWLAQHTPDDADVHYENQTQSHGVLAITGPAARDILQALTHSDLSNAAFPWLSAQPVSVAGVEALALRVSYAGELGWELHHRADQQLKLYEAIKTGDRPPVDFGFYALNAMRIEKAYKAWGVELTVENTAWELGLGRFVAMHGRDFVGREALLRQREQGLARQFVYVEVETETSDAIGGEPVIAKDKLVGVMVSGAYGHRVQKSLGFALVDQQYTEVGTSLMTELLGRPCAVRVIEEPAYDSSNLRTRV